MAEQTDVAPGLEIDLTAATPISDIIGAFFACSNAHDTAAMARFWTDDCTWRIEPEERTLDRDEAIAWFDELFAGFPDFRAEVRSQVIDGDLAVTEWTVHGTHAAEWQGIAATGRTTQTPGVTVTRYVDGKMAESTMYFDGMKVGRNLGLMPPLGSRADRAMTALFNARTAVAKRLKR